MAVKAIPDGYHSVTPYLIVRGAARALDFYKKAFHAHELVRMSGPGDSVMHCEFRIGNSVIMMGDEAPERGARSPDALGGSATGLCIYVEDADAMFAQAVAAGGTVERPVQDQFYGDRSGTLRDPFGHQWTVATHKEDVSPEEMDRRMAEMMKSQS